MSFFFKKSTSHCVATLCFSTNASFTVGKWVLLLCLTIGLACIFGSSMQLFMSYASYTNASPCAKMGTKLPIPPTTWATTFKRIDIILKPTMTNWAILCLFSSFIYLISSLYDHPQHECHQYFHTRSGGKLLQSPITYQQVDVVVSFFQW